MKADRESFQEFLRNLPRTLSLDRIRAQWTRFAFHFTDLRNAAKILSDGEIRSRSSLQDGDFVDCASPRIISNTSSPVKDNVRLYFRPRTPTQFRSEGIRPVEHFWEMSHCPVPVFLLFDLLDVLTIDDCQFSDGNLASLGFSGLCSTAQELSCFNFSKIYHDGWVSKENLRDMVTHQNAEIVIPNRLRLDYLRFIYCRSAAERETLLHLLPPTVRETWNNRIAVASTATFFYRNWIFVESVRMLSTGVQFNFSPDPQIRGPYDLRIIRRGTEPKEQVIPNYYLRNNLAINFTVPTRNYEMLLYLDDSLAFAGQHDDSSFTSPF